MIRTYKNTNIYNINFKINTLNLFGSSKTFVRVRSTVIAVQHNKKNKDKLVKIEFYNIHH